VRRTDVTWAIRAVALLAVALWVTACGGSVTKAGAASPAGPASPVPAASLGPAPAASLRPIANLIPIADGGVEAVVTRVVDGDTIHANLAGKDEKVRIIGLDSPETDKPETPVECFAREATAAAERLLPVGTRIRLQADPTQETRDRFGRLLAHVVLPNGRLFAEVMIEQGYATQFIYEGVPSVYADRLAAAENRAIAAEAGLWSPTTCAGNGHQSSALPWPTLL
jgi:micrococcal nuclease